MKKSHAQVMREYWKRYPEKRGAWARANPEKVARIHRRFHGQPEPTRPCPERCELCGALPHVGRWKKLHLDHCHVTGVFRGWLCHLCNFGLGHFRDNPVLLRTGAAYLERKST